MDGGDGAADGKETDEGQVDQQGGPAVIEYKRDDKVLDLPNPEVGRWTATVAGAEVCEVEVSVEIIDTWGRLCALDVAHMLPEGCDPVVREWLETGDEGLRGPAEVAARAAARDVRAAWAAEAAAWAAARDAARAVRAAGAAARDAAGSAWSAWSAAWDAAEDAQRTHLHRLIWTAHGQTLTTRARIELARDLRYRGEHEAAAAVLPIELREVAT